MSENELHPKQRTIQQNRALWLFMEILAKELNNSGLDMRLVLKPTYKIDWTKENIHDHLWIPIQKALYGTDSTTFLKKQEQIDKIHEIIMRELGEKHSLEYIPFPVDDQKQYEKHNYGTYQH
jgi:hypothetical protein